LAPFVRSALASIASRPALMTLRNAPRVGQDGGSRKTDLPDGLSDIFFTRGLDSQFADLPVGQITSAPVSKKVRARSCCGVISGH
jgi:hypothetical protein